MISANPPARPLLDLVASIPSHELRGDPGADVATLVYRADDATAGALFFCVPGNRADGHAFASRAVARGATVLVLEHWLPDEATQVRVASTRAAMGPIASSFYGEPSRSIPVAGITGTNGKTTTTYLLASILREAGMTPGLIGTTGAILDLDHVPFPRTTPEAPDLQRLFAEMVSGKVRAIAMEVSSHGLAQHRVDGTRFAVSAFTNLTQDHLDYHGSMEEYFDVKARLFTPGLSDRAAICVDDLWGRALAARCELPAITFGSVEDAELRATNVEATTEGVSFRIGSTSVSASLRGAFNVQNCLAAFACARQLGIDDDVAARGIAAVPGVPGRVQTVDEGQEFLVLVDYAHTPDGVDALLRAARPLSEGRVLVVLGCGGDRDRAKRPGMGRAATALADLTVLTSDNPRSEEPRAIIADMEPGAREGGGPFVVEVDRRAAIELALDEARAGDVVVIAGKGHETAQEFVDGAIPFDDRAVAAELLRAREARA